MQGDVLAIVPARAGSKGIPHKNIKEFCGHPLLAWSVVAATHCPAINRVILSTDSEHYAAIGKAYGAECPFLRPAKLATDTSTDREFLLHALDWLAEHEQYQPKYVVLLRPTTPLREISCISKAIGAFKQSNASSLCSGFELPESPVKYFRLNSDGTFSGFMGDKWLHLRRQECPKAYVWDGVIDIFRTDRLQNEQDIYGPQRMAWITQPTGEIDTPEEWAYLEFLVQRGHARSLFQFLQNIIRDSQRSTQC